ncbi:histidine kinase dimerization/phosphoacceptor domain-containing protein [Embleya sp. NPDC059259]
MARELHDVVAHSMSLITVQAGVAHLVGARAARGGAARSARSRPPGAPRCARCAACSASCERGAIPRRAPTWPRRPRSPPSMTRRRPDYGSN